EHGLLTFARRLTRRPLPIRESAGRGPRTSASRPDLTDAYDVTAVGGRRVRPSASGSVGDGVKRHGVVPGDDTEAVNEVAYVVVDRGDVRRLGDHDHRRVLGVEALPLLVALGAGGGVD